MNELLPYAPRLAAFDPLEERADAAEVRLGVIMLCHENLPLAARMARIWVDGGASVGMHIDAKAPDAEVADLRAQLSDVDISFARRRSCGWGTFSLVSATLETVELMLSRQPELTHILLVSGACLPLRPADELRLLLARNPAADFIESVNVRDVGWTVGGLNEERFTLFFPFSFRQQRRLFDRSVDWQRRLGIKRRMPRGIAPHIGSQWWCLTTKTLRAIMDDPRRAEFDRYFRHVWIPDESYFQTLARRHSVKIESRSLTLAKFDAQGKPYVFYDDHLNLLANSHVFVARKIWPGASALYSAFPSAGSGVAAHEEPDSERLEALLDRAAQRRQRGRPGLIMQSRFPRKDAENGKTAQRYTVIYGLADIVPGLRGWLSAATRRDVHGHLFSSDEIEFAGGGETGPGALTSNPGFRDLDPKGFLTSLIRTSPPMPSFLFSPRDRQDLTAFIATDSNADLFVVTGAWVAPLLHCDMPFDDIRHIAARLQRTEIAFLDLLETSAVKARVRIRSLTEVVAKPDEMLAELCQTLRPESSDNLPALPPLRDMSGGSALLRRLRNAGLQPRGMGDPRLLRALTTEGALRSDLASHPDD